MNQRPSLRTITVSLICLLLPITFLAGMLAAAFYKTNNPDNTDITAGLAYLRQIMTVSIVVFAAIVAVITGFIVRMYRTDRNFSQAKLPIVLLVATVGLVVGCLLVNAYTNSVEDQYLRDQGRPTLNEFFDTQEQQKAQ